MVRSAASAMDVLAPDYAAACAMAKIHATDLGFEVMVVIIDSRVYVGPILHSLNRYLTPKLADLQRSAADSWWLWLLAGLSR